MKKICIFAGTTEGRELVDFLREYPVDLTVCVATEYGETLLDNQGITLRTGRMDLEEMVSFLPDFSLVIDCTHPYATIVTRHIMDACKQSDVEYLRVNRSIDVNKMDEMKRNIKEVSTMKEMAEYLETKEGNIFSTLGSKELQQFKGYDFVARLYARVLPVVWSLEACAQVGIHPSHVVAIQGPFSYDYNKTMFQTYQVGTVLTKESGGAGGFEEKCKAAIDLGLEVVVLRKPQQEIGLTLEECKVWIEEQLPHMKEMEPKEIEQVEDTTSEQKDREEIQEEQEDVRQLSIISCGMGYEHGLTMEAKTALDKAEICLGTPRLLDVLKGNHQDSAPIYTSKKVKEFLKEHQQYKNIALLVTGDSGFYSAGKEMHKALPEIKCTYYSGISSPVYLASRLGMGWDDCHFVSLHGRDVRVLPTILRNKKTFVLFGGQNTVESLCELLIDYDIEATLSIGENLGSDEENIVVGTPKELIDQCFLSLSCGFVELKQQPEMPHFGWSDDTFERKEKVPMTKAEVRAITLSKLQLAPTSIVYDIGAGTGSVAVEMGNLAPRGKIYAIEQKKSALDILEVNKRKFYMEHMDILAGDALVEIEDLPCPTHVFIGGYSGHIMELLEKLQQKAKDAAQKIRCVINTVTMETISDLTPLLETFSYYEVVEVAISRGSKRGNYHMMLANNPVFVITLECG